MPEALGNVRDVLNKVPIRYLHRFRLNRTIPYPQIASCSCQTDIQEFELGADTRMTELIKSWCRCCTVFWVVYFIENDAPICLRGW